MLKRTTGEKIKRISNIICIVMAFFSIAVGIVTFSFGVEDGILFTKYLGFAIMVVGCLMFWLLNLILSGFAELVDNVSKISKNIKTDGEIVIDKLNETKQEVEKVKLSLECQQNKNI